MTSNWCIISLLALNALAQDESAPPVELLSTAQRWGYGLMTGLGLSLIGFVAAFILVLIGTNIKSENFKNVVKVLFALACGTLIGDAMIHIMGEAYVTEGVDALIVSAVFITALLAFMWLEKLLEALGITHAHWIDDGHGHGNDHGDQLDEQAKKNQEPKKAGQQPSSIKLKVIKRSSDGKSHQTNLEVCSHDLNDVVCPAEDASPTASPTKSAPEGEVALEKKGCLDDWKGKGSAGYMNLVGSLIHNFMDGLTIGLAFATGDKHVYTAVVIAVFAHEIPRELGDVAILLESSFNNRQAIVSNGVINLISILGVIIGLATVGISGVASTYVMVFVAGNFMYIAADIWRHLFKGKWCSSLLQQLFFVIGAGGMFGIKFLEAQ